MGYNRRKEIPSHWAASHFTNQPSSPTEPAPVFLASLLIRSPWFSPQPWPTLLQLEVLSLRARWVLLWLVAWLAAVHRWHDTSSKPKMRNCISHVMKCHEKSCHMNSHEPSTRKLSFGVECFFGFFDGTVGWLQFQQEVDYVENEVSQLGSSRNSEVHVSCTHVATCSLFMPFWFPDSWHLWTAPQISLYALYIATLGF